MIQVENNFVKIDYYSKSGQQLSTEVDPGSSCRTRKGTEGGFRRGFPPPLRKCCICVCLKTPENASESVDCIELPNIVVLHIAAHKRLKIAGQTALVSKPRILSISSLV